MTRVRERYVVDPEGKRVEVVLPIEDYESLLEDLEELEAIRAFDAAKDSEDDAVPAEQAFREIDEGAV
jgi:PHD/YefM family antitoxin component YafN of YafNO toxin-antitoxin module